MRTVPIEDLILDAHNANKGTVRGRAMVEQSLKKLGAGRSILIDKHGHVIAGNKTLEAARKAGRKTVTVIQTDGDELVAVRRGDLDLDSEKGRELAIADNRSSELGLEWDADALKLLDLDLEQFWNESELRKLLPQEDVEAPEPQLDKAAQLQKKWKTARGQIWEIGRHRLMCGDCTKDIPKLLGKTKIDFMLTDPPYGVGIEYGECKDTPEEIRDLIHRFMEATAAFRPALLTSGHRLLWDYPRPDWILAWVHPAGMGRNPWGFTQFNPILAYGKCPYLASGLGSRPDSLVLATDRKGVEGHPTPKPVEVWKWLMERGSTKTGDNILDPFMGSGTSLVTAEILQRNCFGTELEPKYVAVSLERLSEMGLKPKLVDRG